MKKLIAIVLSVAMLMATSVTAFAAPSNLTDVITDPAGLNKPAPIIKNLDVPVDIKVDADQLGTYEDGPVDKTIDGGSLNANYQATIYMSGVRALFNTLYDGGQLLFAAPEDVALKTRLESCLVSGQFIIKITYPENAVVPTAALNGTNLDGFDASAATTFEETAPRTVAAGATGTKELTITLDVKPGITASIMKSSIETYLPDITFTALGITLPVGTNKVTGTITGHTNIYDVNPDPTPDDLICTINYIGKQGDASGVTGTEISEIVNIHHSNAGINAGPSSTVKDKDKTVTINLPGVEKPDSIKIPASEKNPVIDIEDLTEELNPEREGFVFEGFYDDQYYTNKLSGEVKITENTTIHGRWINVTVPEIFDADNHIQYIHGYPDETVRPESNVSREEIATMFYRLLKEEVREKLKTDVNSFSDVESDRWSNNAVSTMANGGYIKGYADGTFRPEAYITRAELATIAFRFLDAAVAGEMSFNDIGGHWAEENIKSIANNAWIMGYRDGSFRPDEYITRAEAITIINRIVVRYVNEHGLIGDEKQWIDNPADAWYYYAVVEATHEHDHARAEDNYNELWNKSDSGMMVD